MMKTMTRANALATAADLLLPLEGSPTLTEIQGRTALAQAFIALGGSLGNDEILTWDVGIARIETHP